MDSAELSEWMAEYAIEADEADEAAGREPEPTPEELEEKLLAWARSQNARAAK
jgi:hypothetical protein